MQISVSVSELDEELWVVVGTTDDVGSKADVLETISELLLEKSVGSVQISVSELV